MLILILSKSLLTRQILPFLSCSNYHYICNTLINLKTSKNKIDRIINLLENRVTRDKILSLNKCGHKPILLRGYGSLKKYLFTERLETKWRIIVFSNNLNSEIWKNNNIIILFQNHRSLCGGQERIWSILNNLLDKPLLKNKDNSVKNSKNSKIPSLVDIIKACPYINSTAIFI